MTMIKTFNDFRNQYLNEKLDVSSIKQVNIQGDEVAKWLVSLKRQSQDINDENAAKDVIAALVKDTAFINWWNQSSGYAGAIKAMYPNLEQDKPVMNYNLIAFTHRVKEKDKNLIGQEVAKYEVIFKLYSAHIGGFLKIFFDLTKATPQVGLTKVGTSPVNLIAWNDSMMETMRFVNEPVAPKINGTDYAKEPAAKLINPAFIFSNKSIAAEISKAGGNAQAIVNDPTVVTGQQTAGGTTGGGTYTGNGNQNTGGGTVTTTTTGSAGTAGTGGVAATVLDPNYYTGITISNTKNDKVVDLQRRIIAKGGEPANLINSRGKDDGKYGTNTEKAVGQLLNKTAVNPITAEDSAKLVNLLKDITITPVTTTTTTAGTTTQKPAKKAATAIKPIANPGF